MIDQTALSTLFRSLAPRLVLYARQWHDAAGAEDVVQDVFVRLLDADPPPEAPHAWLFRSVRNAAISGLRSRIRRRRRLEIVSRSTEWFVPDPAGLVQTDAVQAALEGLPDDQREILMLRLWGGLTLEQVAEITGRTVSSVFRRYQGGLCAVRRSMETSCTNPTPTTKT